MRNRSIRQTSVGAALGLEPINDLTDVGAMLESTTGRRISKRDGAFALDLPESGTK